MGATERTGGPAPTTTAGSPGDRGRSGLRRIRRALGIGVAFAALASALLWLAWPRPDPDRVWEDAQVALRADRFDEAERAADRLARLREPTDEDVILRAQIAIGRRRIDEALAILERVPDSSRLAPQALLLAGQIELRRDRLRVAESSFDRALELEPRLDQARRELIYIHGYRSESEAIEEHFGHLAASGPLSAEEAFLWSLIRGVQWTAAEIVEVLSRAVERDLEDRRSRIALADALLEFSRFEEAEAALSPLDPSDPDERAALGRLALERGDVEGLRALLEDAPEGHAGLALLRGRLALIRREPEAAIEAYRTALGLRPNDRDALSGLSQALNQAGRQDEAAGVIDRLKRVTELNRLLNEVGGGGRRTPGRFVELGAACEAVGFLPQARAWYQLTIGLDPFHRPAQEALARLGMAESGGPAG